MDKNPPKEISGIEPKVTEYSPLLQGAIDVACDFLKAWEKGKIDEALKLCEPPWLRFTNTPKTALMDLMGGRVEIGDKVDVNLYGSSMATVKFPVKIIIARGVKKEYNLFLNMLCLNQFDLPDKAGRWFICPSTIGNVDN